MSEPNVIYVLDGVILWQPNYEQNKHATKYVRATELEALRETLEETYAYFSMCDWGADAEMAKMVLRIHAALLKARGE